MALSIHHPDTWPELLGTAQVAELLAVTRQTVHAMIDRGELEAVRVGKLWRIPAEAVWPFAPPAVRNTWPPGPWTDATDPDRKA